MVHSSQDCECRWRAPRGATGDDGFGLLEVVIALTVLTIVLLGVGRLLVTTLASAELARQRTEATSIVAAQDASLQHLPTQTTLAAAQTYVSTLYNGVTIPVANGTTASNTKYTVTTATAAGTTSNLMAITITVTWKPAVKLGATQSIVDRLQVPFS